MDDKIFNRILKFINIRPRSEKEVVDYLKRKRIDVLKHRYIIERIKNLNLLDDFEFTKFWIESRISQGKSKKSIVYELKIKGISKEILEEVFNKMEIDELKIAKELVAKKRYKWQKYDEKTRKQKISQYLLSKGYDWNVINDVIKYKTGDRYE